MARLFSARYVLRAVGRAGLLALASASCSVLATTHFYAPRQEASSGAKVVPGGRPVWIFPALSYWGLCLGLVGGSQVATIRDGDFEVEVSSRELEYAVHSVGPVLPVIPNLIFAGPVPEPTLALHVHVDRCREPVRVVLEGTHLVTAEGATVGVQACVPGDAEWSHEASERMEVLGTDPVLKRGGGLWLAFEAEQAGVASFELTLALVSGAGSPVEVRIPFERSHASYYVLIWFMQPGGE